MPKRSDAYMQDRRKAILEAAMKCLSRDGFGKMSVADICKAAGISMGALYKHFRSKDEILLAVIEMSDQERDKLTFGTLAEFRSFVIDLVQEMEEQEPLERARSNFEILYLALKDENLRHKAEKSVMALEEILRATISKFKAEGAVAPAFDVERGARTLNALMNGIWLMKIVTPDLDIGAYLPVIKSIFDDMAAL